MSIVITKNNNTEPEKYKNNSEVNETSEANYT